MSAGVHMELKTENLAILLTDIAGYTEATVSQSRLDNEALIETHNALLLPIVKRFKGRLIKTIGDALLVVFRSPTDAMLCAMAMQDALFAYNQAKSKEKQIHIRVAASLGEVRVARGDIFGEPVNITSRIESITPPDEIYFSEAMFMAMNKAEVPSQEVGWRELKGIAGTVRIYQIPRFGNPRLVAHDVMESQDARFAYPFGGAHLKGANEPGFGDHLTQWGARAGAFTARMRKPLAIAGGITILGVGAVMAAQRWPQWFGTAATPMAVDSAEQKAIPPAPTQHAPSRAAARQPVETQAQTRTAATTRNEERRSAPVRREAPAQTARTTTSVERSAERSQKTAEIPAYPHMAAAKAAYKSHKIDRPTYRKVAAALKAQMRQDLAAVKAEYKADKIDKREYRRRVDAIERRYEGK